MDLVYNRKFQYIIKKNNFFMKRYKNRKLSRTNKKLKLFLIYFNVIVHPGGMAPPKVYPISILQFI